MTNATQVKEALAEFRCFCRSAISVKAHAALAKLINAVDGLAAPSPAADPVTVERVRQVLEDHFWRDDYDGSESAQRLYFDTAAKLAIRALIGQSSEDKRSMCTVTCPRCDAQFDLLPGEGHP